MTCQLSLCERYRPVRRWWNHFIIYKNHPSTWCLRFPMGSKNIPSIPIQLANSRCDPPHVGTTEPENIMQSASSTENITPSVRGIINNEPWTIVFFYCSISNRRLLLLMSHEVGSVSWGLGGKAVWNHWAMPVEPRAMAAFHMVRSVHLQPTWPTGIIGCDCVYNMSETLLDTCGASDSHYRTRC